MVIYISHKRKSDFEKEIYLPIKESVIFQNHKVIFPHEGGKPFDSSDIILNNKVDLIIAEVSYPATGQGIELGWAFLREIPIICIYKTGADFARSLESITNRFIEYDSKDDLVKKLDKVINV